eukprot:CAMPEP_0202693552 /NCGR_PEP_ID=MMETSP1385-20130828/7630_1 /ASSEMBLY_ACC=CAM_ASM_000861 /TAXON_ID=933848 /ORGANISM="Elphidium margaritaceum" /LENGTH=589 /DNA_ID=CAMNT_0049349243 /DNA_START=48 /DNA_END=1817 /DNA_ORIENTATION=-
MPPPQAIVCHICNGKYFKRSFPIHLKQCEEKWKKTHSRCEYCGTAVANHDWSDHRTHCKPTKKRKALKQANQAPLTVPKADHQQLIPTLSNKQSVVDCQECASDGAIWKCVECEQSLCAICEVDLHRKGARLRHTRIPIHIKALQKENLSILSQTHQNQAEQKDCDGDADDNELEPPQRDTTNDARAECKFCQRRFNPDRVEKHMRICNVIQKKAGKRRVYDGAKQRIQGTEFEEFQYHRAQTPPIIKEWKKNGRRWKGESSQLREIAAINTDSNTDNKDEERDIVIKAPEHRPTFSKTDSALSICNNPRTSASLRQRRFAVAKAPAAKARQTARKTKERPSSNTSCNSSSISLKGNQFKHSSVKSSNKSSQSHKHIPVSKASAVRMGRTNTKNMKPPVPKFEPRKVSKSENVNTRLAKSKTVEAKLSFQNRMKPKMDPKPVAQPRENPPVKTTVLQDKTPAFQRRLSAASSLQRGSELGLNVNGLFGDKPKSMNEYVERERLRRQKKQKATTRPSQAMVNVKAKPQRSVADENKHARKRMSRFQMKQEIKVDNEPIGRSGHSSGKPSNAKDLASKRAAYFETLLQNQE